MKSSLDKTMDLIANKKQSTLGDPVTVIEQKEKKKSKPKGPTYWVCMNHHIFRHNFSVHKDREKAGLRCPECGAAVKNRVNEKTYLDYRKETGRVNEKEYRLRQAREAERRLNRLGGP